MGILSSPASLSLPFGGEKGKSVRIPLEKGINDYCFLLLLLDISEVDLANFNFGCLVFFPQQACQRTVIILLTSITPLDSILIPLHRNISLLPISNLIDPSTLAVKIRTRTMMTNNGTKEPSTKRHRGLRSPASCPTYMLRIKGLKPIMTPGTMRLIHCTITVVRSHISLRISKSGSCMGRIYVPHIRIWLSRQRNLSFFLIPSLDQVTGQIPSTTGKIRFLLIFVS